MPPVESRPGTPEDAALAICPRTQGRREFIQASGHPTSSPRRSRAVRISGLAEERTSRARHGKRAARIPARSRRSLGQGSAMNLQGPMAAVCSIVDFSQDGDRGNSDVPCEPDTLWSDLESQLLADRASSSDWFPLLAHPCERGQSSIKRGLNALIKHRPDLLIPTAMQNAAS